MCLRFRVSFVSSENQKYHGKRKTIITKQNISKVKTQNFKVKTEPRTSKVQIFNSNKFKSRFKNEFT